MLCPLTHQAFPVPKAIVTGGGCLDGNLTCPKNVFQINIFSPITHPLQMLMIQADFLWSVGLGNYLTCALFRSTENEGNNRTDLMGGWRLNWDNARETLCMGPWPRDELPRMPS